MSYYLVGSDFIGASFTPEQLARHEDAILRTARVGAWVGAALLGGAGALIWSSQRIGGLLVGLVGGYVAGGITGGTLAIKRAIEEERQLGSGT